MLSLNIRESVTDHIFKNSFLRKELFKKDDIIETLINNLCPFILQPDENVIEQGEQGTHFYFIAEGSCNVIVNYFKDKIANPDQLNKGDYFGECSVFYDCPRTATVMSSNYCTFA